MPTRAPRPGPPTAFLLVLHACVATPPEAGPVATAKSFSRSAPIWSETTTLDGGADFALEIVCALGDANGDGYPDLAAGSPDSGDDKGALGVWYGGASGYAVDPDLELWGAAADDRFASACSGGGDLDGDGTDDLVVTEGGSATVRVYLGGASGISEEAVAEYTGTSEFGSGVSILPDVNGDGYDDLGIADPGAGVYGEAYVYLGSAAGPEATASSTLSGSLYYSVDEDGIVGLGDVDGDGYGDVLLDRSTDTRWYAGSASGLTYRTTLDPGDYSYSVAPAGDIDADGYLDVIFGHPSKEDAYVYYGSALGLTGPTKLSSSENDFGAYVAAAGDVDADGYGDVIVTYLDGAAVYFGTASGISTSGSSSLSGDSTQVTACAGPGDVDGDGYDDVALAQGDVGVYPGARTGTSDTASVTLRERSATQLGRKLASGVDLDGDGYGDVVAGAYDPYSSSGGAYVYFGGEGGIDDAKSYFLQGATAGAYVGDALDAEGDLNGDGWPDVVLGGHLAESVEVHHGSASGPSAAADLVLTGTSSTDFGYALDVVGDLDADGYDDLVVGIPNSGSYGVVRVYWGDAGGLSSSAYTTLTGSSSHKNFGLGVGSTGDADGDGAPEVVVYDNSYSGADRVEVYEGTASGLGTTAVFSLSGSVGAEWSPGGDINGDGYTDTVTGADNVAYAYFGSASGLSSSDYDRVLAPSTSYTFATEVSGVGDVDGDGFDDVAIGGMHTASYAGEVYVYPGGASGFGSGELFSETLGGNSEQYGAAIGGPTDLDADGLLDLVVGGYQLEGGAGALYLYTGGGDEDGDGYDGFDDCDDGDATIHPGATEVCDAADVDEDCDGSSDDADASVDPTSTATFYEDGDADGYGDPASATAACDAPAGFVEDATDCDDASSDLSPGATEVCDAADVDEDCDGVADNADDSVDAASLATFFADADGDAFGDATSATAACDAPAGAVADATDCDDGDAGVNSAATEACNDRDDDCDGGTDEAGASGEFTSYSDADGDGYGWEASSHFGCAAPEGYVETSGDCDDGDPNRSPAATEVCNARDDDCDAAVDEAGAAGETTTYADADGDGYGDEASASTACDPAPGAVERGGDCDDANASRSPDATEVCATEWDDDCDGDATGVGAADATTWYLDQDGDGHGDAYVTTRACTAPGGYVAVGDDCDDDDASRTTDCEPDTGGTDSGGADTATPEDTGTPEVTGDPEKEGGADPAACGCGNPPVAPAAFPLAIALLCRRRATPARATR